MEGRPVLHVVPPHNRKHCSAEDDGPHLCDSVGTQRIIIHLGLEHALRAILCRVYHQGHLLPLPLPLPLAVFHVTQKSCQDYHPDDRDNLAGEVQNVCVKVDESCVLLIVKEFGKVREEGKVVRVEAKVTKNTDDRAEPKGITPQRQVDNLENYQHQGPPSPDRPPEGGVVHNRTNDWHHKRSD